MTVRRITALMLGAALLVLGFAGSANAGEAPPVHLVGGNANGQHLFVIGDSITDITTPDLTKTLKRYSYVIDATVGIKMAAQLPTIQRTVATTPPQDWIIELGTNDWANPNAQQDFTNEVNAVSGQNCVVLVTTAPLVQSLKALNARMGQIAATNKKFHVLDWGDIEYKQPHLTLPDAIHPSIKGQQKLASLERWILKADCPR